MNMKISKNSHVIASFLTISTISKYPVDSFANRWNYTVGDNHRVDLSRSWRRVFWSRH